MGKTNDAALALFGATGDLAYKKIFPALYAMAKRGAADYRALDRRLPPGHGDDNGSAHHDQGDGSHGH